MSETTKRREMAIKHVINYEEGFVAITNLTNKEEIRWNHPEFDSANVTHKLALYGWNKLVSTAKAKGADSTINDVWKALQAKATEVISGQFSTRVRSTLAEKMIKQIEESKKRPATEEEIAFITEHFGY